MKRWMFAGGLLVAVLAAVVVAQPPHPPEPPPGPPHVRPVIDVLDADHDGVISAEELKNATSSLLKLDKNNDGKLTEDEFRPPRPGPGPPGGGRHGPSDRHPEGPPLGRDGDGPPARGDQSSAVSADRMVAKAMEFDADSDGKLNKEELQKFIADFLTRHGADSGSYSVGPPRGRDAAGQNPPWGGHSNDGERPERPRRPAQ